MAISLHQNNMYVFLGCCIFSKNYMRHQQEQILFYERTLLPAFLAYFNSCL